MYSPVRNAMISRTWAMHTYSTSNTYKHTRKYIHTLRQIPKTGSKVCNRNLSLNHSKNLPNPTKFYQSSSFYIPYRMPIKKTPNESRTKNGFREQFPARVAARVGSRGQPRGRAGSSSCAVFTLKRGFSPQYSKSEHFQPKSCLYNTPTHLITFYNIKPLPKLKIDDQLIITSNHFHTNPKTLKSYYITTHNLTNWGL